MHNGHKQDGVFLLTYHMFLLEAWQLLVLSAGTILRPSSATLLLLLLCLCVQADKQSQRPAARAQAHVEQGQDAARWRPAAAQ